MEENNQVKFKNLIPITEDIASLKSDISYIKTDINDIKNNHLKEIRCDIKNMKKLLYKIMGGIAVLVFLLSLFGDKISRLIFK